MEYSHSINHSFRYFEWSVDSDKDWENLWDDFFLLYDIMHEPVSHLVEPVLPRFDLILRKPASPSTPHLHSTWWSLLFYRGFQNDTVSVKRKIVEYVLSIESLEALNVLGCEFEFIFSALFITIDNTALYSVPTLGTMVSPFGEMVRTFVGRLIQAYKKDEDRVCIGESMHGTIDNLIPGLHIAYHTCHS